MGNGWARGAPRIANVMAAQKKRHCVKVYFDNPGTNSPPVSILIVDPAKSFPIGWN